MIPPILRTSWFHASRVLALSASVFTALMLMVAAVRAQSPSMLDKGKFAEPPTEYRPIDCWWWEQGELSRERIRWQLEQMHQQGVGGTWLYPRYGAAQPQSCEPGFWTEGWWEFVRYSLDEHQRLGMVQYANDWLGRLDKSYFQNRLKEQTGERPELAGQRLMAHRLKSSAAETLRLRIPEGEQILSAAAYRLREAQESLVDGASREDLTSFIEGQEVVSDRGRHLSTARPRLPGTCGSKAMDRDLFRPVSAAAGRPTGKVPRRLRTRRAFSA